MFVYKDNRGVDVIASELPETVSEWFKFDLEQLPIPENDEASDYKLVVDYTTHTFRLTPIQEADTIPTDLDRIRADLDYISALTGVEL